MCNIFEVLNISFKILMGKIIIPNGNNKKWNYELWKPNSNIVH